jgi:hypothetical protein
VPSMYSVWYRRTGGLRQTQSFSTRVRAMRGCSLCPDGSVKFVDSKYDFPLAEVRSLVRTPVADVVVLRTGKDYSGHYTSSCKCWRMTILRGIISRTAERSASL